MSGPTGQGDTLGLGWSESEEGDPEPAETAGVPALLGNRYEPREELGRGGMGLVWRAWDRVLQRTVAVKMLAGTDPRSTAAARFAEEAQVSAQLQHPGIVPIHDYGVLEDGRMWFVMKEVRGRTLRQLVYDVHDAWRRGSPSTRDGFTLRRLIDAFHRVCETVGYAHDRGVVHRDLKPENIMIGAYGEVLVLDWGLAHVPATGAVPDEDCDGPVRAASSRLTKAGVVAGTPAYMSPEQARGAAGDVGPTADVYALGATLYDVLAERPPHLARSAHELIARVAYGNVELRPPSEVTQGPPVDPELDRICLRALAHVPEDRHADAATLGREVAAWLDGARKRERAMALVVEARDLLAQRDDAAREAAALAQRAGAAREAVRATAPDEDKVAVWSLEDAASAARARRRTTEDHAVQRLRSALTHAPDLAEAHAELAQVLHGRHVRLEHARRHEDVASVALELEAHDRAGRFAAYLQGTGAVTLITEPPGATVQLFRYTEHRRRLVPTFVRELGRTPLVEAPLPMGRYLLVLEHPETEPTRYPVAIGRLEHWDGVPPGGRVPEPVPLPRRGAIGPDDCYVPAGWFVSGEDESELRLWCAGFVARRFPVTVGAYVAYLNDLLDEGDAEGAARAEPRLPDSAEPFFGRLGGRFTGIRSDRSDAYWDIVPRDLEAPATSIDFPQAVRYTEWLSAREGLGWRLPMSLEWQKAARGVDGRLYPWGDHLEPPWCRMKATCFPRMFTTVHAHPVDQSPYGLRGMAGNTSDWVGDPGTVEVEHQRVRIAPGPATQRFTVGGSYVSGPIFCKATPRRTWHPNDRNPCWGFRVVRGLAEKISAR